MAQSRFKFDSASNYAAVAVISSDSGVYTQLTCESSGLKIKTSSPSPYQGSAYVYFDSTYVGGFTTPSYLVDQTETKYLDFFYYDNRFAGSSNSTLVVSGDDWYDFGNGYFGFYSQALGVGFDGTIFITGGFGYYNPDTGDSGGFGATQGQSSAGAIPSNEWCRIRVQVNTTYLGPVEIYKGFNILGPTPDVTVAGSSASFPTSGSGSYPNYLRFGTQNSSGRFTAIDDLYISNITWPTREVSGTIAYGPSIRR
jgi:hypothetical protein